MVSIGPKDRQSVNNSRRKTTQFSMFSLRVATDKPARRLCPLIALLILLEITKSTTSETCGIKNGTSWPWNVQLVDSNERNVLCEGTLVSDQLVITAAHCLHDSDGDPLDLYRFSILLNDGTLFPITRTHYPKTYDPLKLDHDVALVALNRKIAFNRLVGPVCVAATTADSKLKATEDIHCPAFGGERTLDGRSEEACRTTTQELFRMTYDGVVCMGRFQKSHNFYHNTGSGLVLKSFGVWNLIGILMYTTGQSNTSEQQANFAGGLRIERYIPWIGRMIRHYANPGIAEEKCKQYNREGSPSSNDLYTVNLRSSQGRCYGALISPRFVLSTAECANQTTQVMVSNGPASKTQPFDIIRLHYEEWNRKIALIELKEEVSSSFSPITCLWNGSIAQNFTKDPSTRNESLVTNVWFLSRVQFVPESSLLQVWYSCPSPEHHMIFTSLGDLLGVHVAGDARPRLVGLLDGAVPCDDDDYYKNRQRTAEAINVQQYLPWIEDVVWRN